jgi:Ca2+-binding EF-hand superfamily protein
MNRIALAALGLCLLAPVSPAKDEAGKKEGKKDPGEMAAGLKMLLDAFPVIDADGDGKLSDAELPAREVIAALDADRDGFVTRQEIERALKAADSGYAGRKPGDNEPFAEWAKKRVAVDPRFNAEARRTQFLANFDQEPKDGKVAKKEYAGADADKVFRDFDQGKDGFLDANEILALMKDQLADLEKARRRPTRANFLVLFDLDDDRNVTRDEYVFLRGPSATFVSYDEDGDGIVTYDELLYYNRGSKDRKYKGKDGGPAAQAPPPEKRDVWDLYDKDKDGRVTAEEFAGGEAVFRRLDRNRDGALTAADL